MPLADEPARPGAAVAPSSTPRRATGQAALGEKTPAYMLSVTGSAAPSPRSVHPSDPRRPRRRPEPEGTGNQRAAAARRTAGGSVKQIHESREQAGEARWRALHRGPLRGPRPLSRIAATEDMRVRRGYEFDPGDADLLQARRRAPDGDVRAHCAPMAPTPSRQGYRIDDPQPRRSRRTRRSWTNGAARSRGRSEGLRGASPPTPSRSSATR